MIRQLQPATIIIFALLITAFLFAYTKPIPKNNKTNTVNENISASPIKINTGIPNKAMEKLNNITIQNNEFNPKKLTVKLGSTVTWINLDTETHSIYANEDSPQFPNSNEIQQTQAYQYKFIEPGIYKYHCATHKEMSGEIEVID